jgi:uncharacterized protein with gpF-like domain
MAAIPLAAMARRSAKSRKREVTFRPIGAPGTLASDLYSTAYAPVIQAWTAAIDPVLKAYELALAQMQTDSAENISSVLTGTEGEFTRVMISIRLRLEAWAKKVEGWHRGKWRGAVLTATGVDLSTMLGAGDVRTTLAATIERNVGLIKSVSEQARSRISDAVFRGLTQRKAAAIVAKEIREAVAMTRRRALNIAAHQTSQLGESLNAARRAQAGIDTWEWVHSAKKHPRKEHLARDGKRYSDENPPSDLPSELPNCGCTSRAVLSLDGPD